MSWPCPSGPFTCTTSCIDEMPALSVYPNTLLAIGKGTTGESFQLSPQCGVATDCTGFPGCQTQSCEPMFQDCGRESGSCFGGDDDNYGVCCAFRRSDSTFVSFRSIVSTQHLCACRDQLPDHADTFNTFIVGGRIPLDQRTSIANICVGIGACCDPDRIVGRCRSGQSFPQCTGPNARFFHGKTCSEITGCAGACCLPGGQCSPTIGTQWQCDEVGGTFHEGVGCDVAPCGDLSCCICGTCVGDLSDSECVARGGERPNPDGPCNSSRCAPNTCAGIMLNASARDTGDFADELPHLPGRVHPLTNTPTDSGVEGCQFRFGHVYAKGDRVTGLFCNDRGADSLCRTISDCPVIANGDRVSFECEYREMAA